MAINSMDFAFGDAYPSYLQATTETGLLANPEKEDQEALQESESVSEKADISSPQKNRVFLSILMIFILVIIFGAVIK